MSKIYPFLNGYQSNDFIKDCEGIEINAFNYTTWTQQFIDIVKKETGYIEYIGNQTTHNECQKNDMLIFNHSRDDKIIYKKIYKIIPATYGNDANVYFGIKGRAFGGGNIDVRIVQNLNNVVTTFKLTDDINFRKNVLLKDAKFMTVEFISNNRQNARIVIEEIKVSI